MSPRGRKSDGHPGLNSVIHYGMRRVVMVCFGLAALAPAPGAAAQGARPEDRWDREGADLLRRAGQALTEQGYRMRSEPPLGSLQQGETQQLAVGLREGGEYALVAVCDSACSNIELRLFDETSREVAAALEPGAAVLRFTPGRNGKYRLRVTMAACGHSPCRYSVGVFER
jgi:hypothetical protein